MELFHKLDGVLPTPEEMDRQLREAGERRQASWERLRKRADSIRVVDFHVHTFPETIAARARYGRCGNPCRRREWISPLCFR